MYTFSISVLIQALLIISMSGAADHGMHRKTFLLNFAFIGAIATMLFLPVTPQVFVFGALLAIIANTCFGASFVLLNSFLPLIVRNHPQVVEPYLETEDSYGEEDDGYREHDRSGTEDEEELEYDEMPNSRSALLRNNSYADDTPLWPKSPAVSNLHSPNIFSPLQHDSRNCSNMPRRVLPPNTCRSSSNKRLNVSCFSL